MPLRRRGCHYPTSSGYANWMNKKALLWGIRTEMQQKLKCSFITSLRLREEKIKERLNAAKFIALMTDGSTDSSVSEEEMVYVRTCVAGTKAVEKADAENITDAVKEVMGTPSEDWEKKLVAITTDGVMTGSKNGVVCHLKKRENIHCGSPLYGTSTRAQFQRCNKRR